MPVSTDAAAPSADTGPPAAACTVVGSTPSTRAHAQRTHHPAAACRVALGTQLVLTAGLDVEVLLQLQSCPLTSITASCVLPPGAPGLAPAASGSPPANGTSPTGGWRRLQQGLLEREREGYTRLVPCKHPY